MSADHSMAYEAGLPRPRANKSCAHFLLITIKLLSQLVMPSLLFNFGNSDLLSAAHAIGTGHGPVSGHPDILVHLHE